MWENERKKETVKRRQRPPFSSLSVQSFHLTCKVFRGNLYRQLLCLFFFVVLTLGSFRTSNRSVDVSSAMQKMASLSSLFLLASFSRSDYRPPFFFSKLTLKAISILCLMLQKQANALTPIALLRYRTQYSYTAERRRRRNGSYIVESMSISSYRLVGVVLTRTVNTRQPPPTANRAKLSKTRNDFPPK